MATNSDHAAIWDIVTGEALITLDLDDETSFDRMLQAAFSSDGATAVTVAFDDDADIAELVHWDAATGEQITAFTLNQAFVREVAFDPHTGDIMLLDTPRVSFVDRVTGETQAVLEPGGLDAAYSPDGERLAIIRDAAIYVWRRSPSV